MEPKPIEKPSEEAWESALIDVLDGKASPATPKGWWLWTCVYEHGDELELKPTSLNLDRLWEAEEQLSHEQRLCYSHELDATLSWGAYAWSWHATAAQKIKTLAAVIRGEAGDNS
jgi:hypothetical protein